MTFNALRRAAFGTVSALALLAAAPAAFAQTTPTAEEEIVVTARKRSEALLDVPFSVNALSENQLRDRGAITLEDVSRNVAGFTVQNLGPGQSQVAIRGVAAGQIVRDQPGVKEQVGVYLDESVISLSLFTPDLDLFDLNRVEVLRGPQGTLYGSGSLAGTVRYITNQPSTDAYEGTVEMTASKVDEGELGGELKALANVPLGDKAALRIVGYGTGFPGFIDAVQPGGGIHEDVNGGDRFGFRAALMFQPTPALTITPRIIYQNIDISGYNRVDRFNILANQFTTTRPKVTLKDLQQFTQFDERFRDETQIGDLNINYDFGAASLTSVTSYTHRDVLVLRDATQLTGSITGQPGVFAPGGLSEAVFTLNAPLFDTTAVESWTQELRLASNGDNRFDWVVGAFYSDTDRVYGQDLPVIGFTALTGIATAGVVAPTDHLFFSNIPYNLKQYAFFGEGTLALTDRLDATVGVRYSNYEEERQLTFDGVFAVQTIRVPGRVEDDDVAPRFILSWKATDDVSLNAQASKGFRLGGINDPLNAPLCGAADLATFGSIRKESFKNETVWNYEVGMKSRLAGGHGSFTAAAFYSDISDLQATIDAGSCSSRIIANVPSARSVGAEAELSLRPTDNFDFAVSASYNNSELTSSVKDNLGNPIQGFRDGNRLPTVPEFQAAASATYEAPVNDKMTGFGNVTYQYVGDRFTQISDQEANPRTVTLIPIGAPTVTTLTFPLTLPDYQVVNLRAGLRGDSWEIAAFVNNVGDERAELALDRERGLRARYGFLTNQPRTVGVTLRKSY